MFPEICQSILSAYQARGRMIATAESCTGGLLAGALTDVPGSSAVFERGFVTYSYASKTALLDVPEEMLQAHGAVSEPVAGAMARGALAHSCADVAVAITGVAGPGASEAKPEGLVVFALATDEGAPQIVSQRFGAIGRANVRRASVGFALELLQGAI